MYRTALARTHRPRRFAELVGQDPVATTLRAAVESGRVAHAYLFCGPRGVGKTTAARVLAMALNCEERVGGEPCGVCGSCESIWSGRTSLDVVEIDAASNRGVDDARDLRERAMYAPSDESRYKVYIVDEAHMLTREAWNALLKILEEPPPRVIFVFATTDPQRIRQTAAPVMSRCQRFDFRRVSVSDLIERLRQVLDREGATAEDAALLPLARRAEGGVRDALSLLDQVLSFSGDTVAVEDVRRMIGLVAEEKYLELFGLMRDGDRAAVFPYVQALLDEGYDLAEFIRGLGDSLRWLLALRMDPDGGAAELPEESRASLAAAAAGFEAERLLRMLVATADFEAAGRFRRSAQPRIQVEVLLLRLVSMESAVALEELLEALKPQDGSGDDGGGTSVTATRGGRDAVRSRPPAGRPDPSSSRPVSTDLREVPEPARDRGDPGSSRGGAKAARRSPSSGSEASTPPPRLDSAWSSALAAAKERGLGGELVGLRGAMVETLDGSTVRLRVPPGLGADLQAFLDDVGRSAALRLELASRLGVDQESLRFHVDDAGTRRRITAEAAREQKLEQLMSTDPRLREAVRTLDLKLKE